MEGIFYKIKKIILFFVLTLLLSCSKLSENPNTTFDDFRSFLTKNFSDVVEPNKPFPQHMDPEEIGASAGAWFKSDDDGLDIVAYLFDEKKKVKEGEIAITTFLKQVCSDFSICVNFECLVSGYFLICIEEKGAGFKIKRLLSKF